MESELGAPKPGAQQIQRFASIKPERYLKQYMNAFQALGREPTRLLELGVYKGGSLLMWHELFPQSTIVGLDRSMHELKELPSNVRFYRGDQQDTALLDRIANETAPGGFDVVIDDASHIASYTEQSFRHIFPRHLRPGGLYVIEDWGTGYWSSWPDGHSYRVGRNRIRGMLSATVLRGAEKASTKLSNYSSRGHRAVSLALRCATILGLTSYKTHSAGMVGFIKTLVDEAGALDHADPKYARHPQPGAIDRLVLSAGLAFVYKSE